MSNKRIPGSLVGGMILIVLGLLSLFGQIFRGFPFLSYLWPFIIIGFGGLFFVGMLAGGKSLAGLAVPGTIIGGLGLMMFLQNLTGYWQSWAYSWTLILVLVGLGIFIMGLYSEDVHHRQAGLRVMKVGAILFIIFGGFFELIFNAFRPYGIQQVLFPLLLVALGVYLVVIRSGLLRAPGGGSSQMGSSHRADSNNPSINLSEEKK